MRIYYENKQARFILLFITFLLQLSCKKDSNDNIALPTSDEYFTWDLNNNKVILKSPNDNFVFLRNGSKVILKGASGTNQDEISLVFSTNGSPGTYFNEPFEFSLYTGVKNYAATSAPVKIIVTKYGNAGDFIVGSFSGTIQDLDSVKFQVKGNFKIRIY